MIKVFVDSGSSIKQNEKEKLGVEIIPLRYLMGETEYLDDIDLSIDEFYKLLIDKKMFPKTSLPYRDATVKAVNEYTDKGYDVIILSISSKISGTYNAFTNWFKDNKKVTVVDTLTAVGGVRLLVQEINKIKEQSVEKILGRINELIPKIKIYAIPETLTYLFRGGRLSRLDWIIGDLLNIKPIITFVNGEVKVAAKKPGLKNAMKYIANTVKTADTGYSIIASYTYNSENLNKLISMTDQSLHEVMSEYDNLDPVIASHWGPNAFGYIFIEKE